MIKLITKHAFVARPSAEWLTIADTLNTTTLFLVSRIGPTVFAVKDEKDDLFRVTLGNPHHCSCSDQALTCVHRLFCLIKVLKVPIQHELCYQTALNDKQLDTVLNGTHILNDRRKTMKKSKKEVVLDNEDLTSNFVARQPLSDDQDETCPICQDEMKSNQALTWCRTGCGNNIHAKCMMKFSQYKISNKQDACCPLCRDKWDLILLKTDCKGKSSLKNSYAPVHCSMCQCLLRESFHRCIECSQASCKQMNGKPTDLCTECFTHPAIGNTTHNTHHFLSSDVRVEITHGLDWIACKNPQTKYSISNISLFNDLENRDINVNDYELLMQLDQSNQVLDVATQCIESLPSYDNVMNTSATLHNKSNKIKPNAQCWCLVSSLSEQTNTSNRNTTLSHHNLRILPCYHVAHNKCLLNDINLLIDENNSSECISSYRCSHENCGKRIFIGLNRKRKTIKSLINNIKKVDMNNEVIENQTFSNALYDFASTGIVGSRCLQYRTNDDFLTNNSNIIDFNHMNNNSNLNVIPTITSKKAQIRHSGRNTHNSNLYNSNNTNALTSNIIPSIEDMQIVSKPISITRNNPNSNRISTGRFGAYGGNIIPTWVDSERIDPLLFPKQEGNSSVEISSHSMHTHNPYDINNLLPTSIVLASGNGIKLNPKKHYKLNSNNSNINEYRLLQNTKLKPLLSNVSTNEIVDNINFKLDINSNEITNEHNNANNTITNKHKLSRPPLLRSLSGPNNKSPTLISSSSLLNIKHYETNNIIDNNDTDLLDTLVISIQSNAKTPPVLNNTYQKTTNTLDRNNKVHNILVNNIQSNSNPLSISNERHHYIHNDNINNLTNNIDLVIGNNQQLLHNNNNNNNNNQLNRKGQLIRGITRRC